MRRCFRLIDDLLTVACPEAEDFLSKVYPKELTLERTNSESDSATFVGMEISSSDKSDRLAISVYDKRKSFPFPVRNYPHLDSVIPKSQAYGVFTGQLYRFHRICTSKLDFVEWAVSIAKYMSQNRGYSRVRLWTKFASFCERGLRYQGVKPRELVLMFKTALWE